MILLAVTTDGRRDCIEQTIPSLLQCVEGIDGSRVIFDDSGDANYQAWLRERFKGLGFEFVCGSQRLGQGLALERVWSYLAERCSDPYVFFCEDDFLFERDVDLDAMRSTLEARPYLAQMALLRQPWFKGEVQAGGIIERDPDKYELVRDGGHEWHEHRLWWTLNPCLFRRELCQLERPTGKKHEWRFSRQLCGDPAVRFGLWGSGEPWVRHIGEERLGVGY